MRRPPRPSADPTPASTRGRPSSRNACCCGGTTSARPGRRRRGAAARGSAPAPATRGAARR
eukprot:10824023-Alexandrium_andersonii.AAC.1